MKIQTIIDNIKKYHKGSWNGKVIDEKTTRDKVLFGNTDQECTNKYRRKNSQRTIWR